MSLSTKVPHRKRTLELRNPKAAPREMYPILLTIGAIGNEEFLDDVAGVDGSEDGEFGEEPFSMVLTSMETALALGMAWYPLIIAFNWSMKERSSIL